MSTLTEKLFSLVEQILSFLCKIISEGTQEMLLTKHGLPGASKEGELRNK